MKRFGLMFWAIALVFLASAVAVWAGPTRVGNGDDGADLEGASRVTEGPVVEARKKAVELLKRLQVEGIAGLGALVPEVQHSELYVARKDSAATLPEDQGGFHADMRGLVFARTFPEPHASTRFFPAALRLSEDQLVALHVHEGLHRALPEDMRQDESLVSAITLSITAPDPTRDRVQASMDRFAPRAQSVAVEADPAVPQGARVRNPSLFGYTYRAFSGPRGAALYPITGMHLIQSFLYPFGNMRNPLGIGVEASLVNTKRGSQSGPLSLSGRMRLWSARGFDVGGWAVLAMNTLSAQELRRSPVGRDVGTVGLSMWKDLEAVYIENFVSYSFAGESTYRIGPYDYRYSYGGVVNASAHVGTGIGPFKLGGFADIGLADYFRVSGPGFSAYDTGRYRLISAGPEVTFGHRNFQLGLAGRWMVNASQDVDFDALGNLMGQGVGQGSLSTSLSLFF